MLPLSRSDIDSGLPRFAGSIAYLQRILPSYRGPFFDLLATACTGGVSVLHGEPMVDEGIRCDTNLRIAKQHPTRNRYVRIGPGYLCLQSDVVPWLERVQPDVLIAEANPRILSTARASNWMRRRGKPVLGHGLGVPPITSRLSFRRFLRGRFLHLFDAFIAYSTLGARQYEDQGVPKSRVFVALNAVASRDVPTPPRRAYVPGHRVRIVYLGRLTREKRVDLLIRACATLSGEVTLTVIGDGPNRAEFEALARSQLPGATFRGDLRGNMLSSALYECDVCVMPGSGGLAIHDAMAHGLPVVVAESDGTQFDLVRKGNGWLVPPGDLRALVDTLRSVISEAPRLRTLGAESYRIVREEISLEAMVASIVHAANLLSGQVVEVLRPSSQ